MRIIMKKYLATFDKCLIVLINVISIIKDTKIIF